MEFLYRNKTIWLGNSIESIENSISVLYIDLYSISGESAENQHRTDLEILRVIGSDGSLYSSSFLVKSC